MDPRRRAQLERRLLTGPRADQLRNAAALRLLAGAIAAPVAPAVGVAFLIWSGVAAGRYVAQQWRLGALMADDAAHDRELARPTTDLRQAPSD